jgi:hypothetical protein
VPQSSLEERVVALERQVAEVKACSRNGLTPKDWRRTTGMFTDDPGMQHLYDQAMKLREADRAQARLSTRRKGPKNA